MKGIKKNKETKKRAEGIAQERGRSKCVCEATKLLRTKIKGGNKDRDSDKTCMRMPKKMKIIPIIFFRSKTRTNTCSAL